MDMNYTLRREQISLHNARIATSSAARIAHEGLAAAYGKLLAESTLPHRASPSTALATGEGQDMAEPVASA